jgi:hypothetical protein
VLGSVNGIASVVSTAGKEPGFCYEATSEFCTAQKWPPGSSP